MGFNGVYSFENSKIHNFCRDTVIPGRSCDIESSCEGLQSCFMNMIQPTLHGNLMEIMREIALWLAMCHSVGRSSFE